MARSEGFEPPTLGIEIRCSIQLSYERVSKYLIEFTYFSSMPDRSVSAFRCCACCKKFPFGFNLLVSMSVRRCRRPRAICTRLLLLASAWDAEKPGHQAARAMIRV